MPVTVSASSRWPFPATPATATISPARTVKRDALHGVRAPVAFGPDVLQLERRLARVRGKSLEPRASSSSCPTISEASERGVDPSRVDGRHGLPAAQHRHAVGDGRHLVQLVRDEDHRSPLVGHRPQRHEERLRLLRRQHRGRLVENQDPRLAVERLQDLDALLLAERELPDPRARVDGDPVALAELGDAALDVPWVDEELLPLAAVVAEDHVLGDGERRHQPEMLVHHADPRVERLARRVELDRLAVEQDLALVGPVEPGEDVRQRALARAVLAEEGVHLALSRLEVHPVVRDDGREPLRDPSERDGRHRRWREAPGGAVGPPATSYPFALPSTPLTSQSIAYSCFTFRLSPRLTRSLPFWSKSGPANS